MISFCCIPRDPEFLSRRSFYVRLGCPLYVTKNIPTSSPSPNEENTNKNLRFCYIKVDVC